MNVLLHLLNTVLLFLVLWRMTGASGGAPSWRRCSAVHPLHVESVAWVAERKDVLCTLFWLLTMGAYLRYVRASGRRAIPARGGGFALGLMCKPMLVTLPFVLLLLDWWPLGRIGAGRFPGFRRGGSRACGYRGWCGRRSRCWGCPQYLARSRIWPRPRVEQFHNSHISRSGRGFPTRLCPMSFIWGRRYGLHRLRCSIPIQNLSSLGIPIWQVAGAVLLLGGLTFLAIGDWIRRRILRWGGCGIWGRWFR